MTRAQPPLGVVAPLPVEARAFTRRFLPRNELAPVDGGVTVVSGGTGADWARWAAFELVRSGARGLVSWGTAAGLDASVEAGALLLPERVVSAELAEFSVDGAWRRELGRVLYGRFAYRGGPLADAGGVLHRPEDKIALFARTRAAGADMESAGVAEVAQDAGVAFMAVRAVSDGVHDPVPRAALSAIGADGALQAGRFIAAWLRRPAETRALVGLAKGFRAAWRTLNGVAAAAGPRLGWDGPGQGRA